MSVHSRWPLTTGGRPRLDDFGSTCDGLTKTVHKSKVNPAASELEHCLKINEDGITLTFMFCTLYTLQMQPTTQREKF